MYLVLWEVIAKKKILGMEIRNQFTLFNVFREFDEAKEFYKELKRERIREVEDTTFVITRVALVEALEGEMFEEVKSDE